MSDSFSFPAVPTIPWDHVETAIRALGFEPNDVIRLTLRPGCCEVVFPCVDETDRARGAGGEMATATVMFPVGYS